MNIIFLDIDGVLNNNASIAMGIHMVPEKVIMLNELCKKVKASIVITSTWRKLYDLPTLKAILQETGLRTAKIIGITGRSKNGFRGGEVEAWVADYVKEKGKHPKYVIIDDDSDFFDYQKQRSFVQTTMMHSKEFEIKKEKEALVGYLSQRISPSQKVSISKYIIYTSE